MSEIHKHPSDAVRGGVPSGCGVYRVEVPTLHLDAKGATTYEGTVLRYVVAKTPAQAAALVAKPERLGAGELNRVLIEALAADAKRKD